MSAYDSRDTTPRILSRVIDHGTAPDFEPFDQPVQHTALWLLSQFYVCGNENWMIATLQIHLPSDPKPTFAAKTDLDCEDLSFNSIYQFHSYEHSIIISKSKLWGKKNNHCFKALSYCHIIKRRSVPQLSTQPQLDRDPVFPFELSIIQTMKYINK